MMRNRRTGLTLFTALGLATIGACGDSDSGSKLGGQGGGNGGAATGSGGTMMAAGSGGRTGPPVGSGGSAPATGNGGSTGSGGSMPTGAGGGTGMGGSLGRGGSPGSGGSTVPPARDGGMDSGTRDSGPIATSDAGAGTRFSFFLTSLKAMRALSKSQNGFGGDLRFGTNSGLEGADKICQTIAEGEGFGGKTWRAFLSVTKGPNGQPVHAIDRVGEGPWYDRRARLIAPDKASLIKGERPNNGSSTAAPHADLPDETGTGTKALGDTHDVVTGSNTMGRLRGTSIVNTCQDWTSAAAQPAGQPEAAVGFGHAWPAQSGTNWIQVHTGHSCVAGVNLMQNGGGNGSSIGAGGGYGGIYCFALQP